MEATFITVLACLIVGFFTIFWVFPVIGKAMRFLVDMNVETNEYRANLLNGFAMTIFLLGLIFLFYCIGIVLSLAIAAL